MELLWIDLPTEKGSLATAAMAKLSRLVVIARAASHAWLGKGRAGR